MTKNSPETASARRLGLWDASALVVGCIIGSGIFRMSYKVAGNVDSPAQFVTAWVLGGLLSLCGAFCYAALSARMPQSGGEYVYLKRIYGPFVGFLFGWTKTFVERTGTIAIVAYIFAEYAGVLLGFSQAGVPLLASAGILGLTTANVAGLEFGKTIQNVFTALKVLAIFLIIIIGFGAGQGDWSLLGQAAPLERPHNLFSSIGLAMIPILFAYDGWQSASHVAGEVDRPERNVPRAIVFGLAGAMVLYLLVNLVYLLHIPLQELRDTKLAASAVMEKIWPGKGAPLVAAMVMVSTFGALNGFILGGGRILQAMGKDHALLAGLGKSSAKTGTPAAALWFNGLFALVLVWAGTLDNIVTYTEVAIYVFYALVGIGIFRLRVKVWGSPWVPALFTLFCAAFVLNGLVRETKTCLIGVGLIAAGAPLYWLSERLKRRAARPA